jgi:hypothetical protein
LLLPRAACSAKILTASIRWQPTLRVLPVEIDLVRLFAGALD